MAKNNVFSISRKVSEINPAFGSDESLRFVGKEIEVWFCETLYEEFAGSVKTDGDNRFTLVVPAVNSVQKSRVVIEFCKERFAGSANIIYHLNDGYTLPVGSSSINFICTWDSLVHCEQDVINSYLAEIYRVLIPGGAAFLHFSNFGRYKGIKQNNHGRVESVTAETVFAQCNELGFNVKTLEKIK